VAVLDSTAAQAPHLVGFRRKQGKSRRQVLTATSLSPDPPDVVKPGAAVAGRSVVEGSDEEGVVEGGDGGGDSAVVGVEGGTAAVGPG
jgi:hypothetical protein